jgi:hypothetical protein
MIIIIFDEAKTRILHISYNSLELLRMKGYHTERAQLVGTRVLLTSYERHQ